MYAAAGRALYCRKQISQLMQRAAECDCPTFGKRISSRHRITAGVAPYKHRATRRLSESHALIPGPPILGPRAPRPPQATGSLKAGLNLTTRTMWHSTTAGEGARGPRKKLRWKFQRGPLAQKADTLVRLLRVSQCAAQVRHRECIAISTRFGFALWLASLYTRAAFVSAPEVNNCRPVSTLNQTCERKY